MVNCLLLPIRYISDRFVPRILVLLYCIIIFCDLGVINF